MIERAEVREGDDPEDGGCPPIVAAVRLADREDGFYLFADAEDGEAFAELFGSDVAVTDEPIFDREQAAELIEAARRGG